MKRLINTFFILMSLLLLLLTLPLQQLHSQDITGNIYVWEFTTREGVRNDITQSLTEEFEEAMIQSECCNVLQRRHYARLLDQKQNETAIRGLNSIPQDKASALKSLDGNAVVFGEVYDDTNSGQVKFSVNFESFDGKILKKASTYLPKYDLANPSKRETAVDKIMEELKISPFTGSKEPLEIKTFGDWEFSLNGCIKIGNTVTCNFVVVSKYRDRHFTVYGNGNPRSIAYDEFNSQYYPNSKSVKVANVQGSHTRRLLIADVRASCSISFPNISTRATRFSKLRLRVQGDDLSEDYIEFGNILIK